MIKALFFDYDGTVSDTRRIAFESVCDTMDEAGLKYSKAKLKKLLGAKSKEIFDGLGIDRKYIGSFRKKLFIDMKEKARNGGISLCVPIAPLRQIGKDHLMVIISNGRDDFIRLSSKILKTDKIFDHTYGSNSFKTKDKLIRKLMRKYKLKPHEIMYVGDRYSDVRYAREAGVYAVAIHNECGWSTMKELIKEKPDFIVHDFKGLKELVDGIE